MSANKPGRNDPCPCGSGRKYKHCCGAAGAGQANTAADGLKNALSDQHFSDEADARAFVDSHVAQANTTGLDDFDGLSPAQMSDLLYAPLASPHRLELAQAGVPAAQAPVMMLFDALADAIGEDGLRTTAKGNLPRAFCKEAHRWYSGVVRHDPYADLGSVNREDDFYDLHVTRVVAQLAGLIRKYKGRFLLTRKARRLRAQDGIYPELVTTHATRFNWGYGDGHEELDFVQHAFAFSLYLLHRHGDTEHDARFYEDAFLRAFPMLLDQLTPHPFFDSESRLRQCYTLRTLERFAAFFGVIQLTCTRTDPPGFAYQITKTPLLDEVVHFHLD